MLQRLRERFAHAFSTAPEPLAEEDARFIDEIAARVVKRRLVAPAILALEGVKYTPGAHMFLYGAMPIAEHFARPVTGGLVQNPEEARRLLRLSERREHIETLIKKIEAAAK